MVKLILVVLAALSLNLARANNIMFKPPLVVTATTVSTMILPQNTLRSYLLIVNTGNANNAYVKFGSVQSGPEGVPVIPAGNYEPYGAPSNSVWVDTASSTTTLMVIEGQ